MRKINHIKIFQRKCINFGIGAISVAGMSFYSGLCKVCCRQHLSKASAPGSKGIENLFNQVQRGRFYFSFRGEFASPLSDSHNLNSDCLNNFIDIKNISKLMVNRDFINPSGP
jgi:hypothetical protein